MGQYRSVGVGGWHREGWFPDDNKPYLAPYDPINNEVEIYLYEDEYYRGDMFGLRRTPHDKV